MTNRPNPYASPTAPKNLLLEDVQYRVVETRFGTWRSYMHENSKTFHEFVSHAQFAGFPLLHYTSGICPETGSGKIARGIVAIGRVAIGFIAIGQASLGMVGIGQASCGFLIGIGQFAIGGTAVAQFAIGSIWALGQFALGYYAIGMLAAGVHPVGQLTFAL